jgi:hypothetical protein
MQFLSFGLTMVVIWTLLGCQIAVSKSRSRAARQQSEQLAHEILMNRLELERLAGPREPAMANLTISRQKRVMERQNAFRVMVDGENIGEVGNGESDSFSLAAGVHEVHLEMRRFSSPSLEVILEPGQTTSLICRPHVAWWRVQWDMLHPGEWIELARDEESRVDPQFQTATAKRHGVVSNAHDETSAWD